jgi:hypothetical protein
MARLRCEEYDGALTWVELRAEEILGVDGPSASATDQHPHALPSGEIQNSDFRKSSRKSSFSHTTSRWLRRELPSTIRLVMDKHWMSR